MSGIFKQGLFAFEGEGWQIAAHIWIAEETVLPPRLSVLLE